MTVYRLILAYDGGEFHGWQRQPEQRSVQGEVEKVLSLICQREVSVQGAGRTDAGVHALGQCASFRLERDMEPRRLFGSLRSLLPDDVTPISLERAADDFNARFSATGRFYVYRLGLKPCAPLRRIRWDLRWDLDLADMRRALLFLRDGTDFTGFCTVEGAAKGSICHLRQLELRELGDELQLHIGADRFLHNMVRIITGTLVEIGRGRWEPERMAVILGARDRRLAGQTAPPQGLFLSRVEYPGGPGDPAAGSRNPGEEYPGDPEEPVAGDFRVGDGGSPDPETDILDA